MGGGANIVGWQTGYNYNQNDQVIVDGWIYACNMPHVSSTAFVDDAILWTQDLNSNTWVSSNTYTQGETVVYAGVTYYRVSTGSSIASPDVDNSSWSLAFVNPPQIYDQYVSNQAYPIYTVVTYNNVNYVAIKSIEQNTSLDPSNEISTTGEYMWAVLWSNPNSSEYQEHVYYDVNQFVYIRQNFNVGFNAITPAEGVNNEAAYALVTSWVVGATYNLNDTVLYNNVTYYARSNNMVSSDSPPPSNVGQWSTTEYIYPEFVSAQAYPIYTIVRFNGFNYAAINTVPSGMSTDPSIDSFWVRLWENGNLLMNQPLFYSPNNYVYQRYNINALGDSVQPTNSTYYSVNTSWVALASYGLNGTVLYNNVTYYARSNMTSSDIPPPYNNVQWSTIVITPPLCLTAGTRVLTPNGYVPVETLKKGGYVTVADGRDVLIKHIHSSHHDNVNRLSAPYIVPAHALGENIPCNTVRLSPDHLVHIGNDCWLSPRHMERRCDQVVQYGMGETVYYYNIMTPEYFTDNLVIEDGVEVEGYGPRKTVFDKEVNAFRRIPKV